MRDPTKERALKCFLSSLVQLSILLIATLLEVIW